MPRTLRRPVRFPAQHGVGRVAERRDRGDAPGVGAVPPDRARWLARPWFFASVAVLALNDHVLKAAWPGPVTGKLSDVAGLVVVGTMASVLLGRSWGVVPAGVAFAALKTVPGVAEAAAPVFGGGVTLRDATDLFALAALPLLWVALGRERSNPPVDKNRRRRVAGLLLAVLATTATSPPAESEVLDVGFIEGDVYARVYLDQRSRSVWLRSQDRGESWTLTDDPGGMSEAVTDEVGPATPEAGSEGAWQQCAADGVCWRARAHNTGTDVGWEHLVERRDPSGDWILDFEMPWTPTDIAVDRGDSTKVAVTDGVSVFVRRGDGRWKEFDLITVAASAN